MSAVVQLFQADTRPAPETDAERLRNDLEHWRSIMAGPCTEECADAEHPHHRHWTELYEENRSTIVMLNIILDGTYPR